jgi:hypothetical protein
MSTVNTDTNRPVLDSGQAQRNRGQRIAQNRPSHELGNDICDTFRDHAKRHAYLRDRWQGIGSGSGSTEYVSDTAQSTGKSSETKL